jgi:hypothetical protein
MLVEGVLKDLAKTCMIAGRNKGKLFTATIITPEPMDYPNLFQFKVLN